MAQFRFYQDTKVTSWTRDYYTIEADSEEDAIKFIKENDMNLEDLEYYNEGRVKFEERDMDALLADCEPTGVWEIYSDGGESDAILSRR